ncbi:MAG: ATP-binding cassette domain-containing protein, partial [Flavobacteriales bacterium]|nr:ATP-binding cassette domain-containing protein [Flavobacteriales bacterium]
KDGLSMDDVIAQIELEKAKDKAIKYFSSGMKQRVKLGLALLSDTPFVLLDEPTSNLDAEAVNWYGSLVNDNMLNRIIIVCSNDQKDEFAFCNQELNISDYK